MPPQRRPGRQVALIASFVAMGLALVLLLQPGLARSAAGPLDAVMVACVLVALVASRWRRR